MWRYPISFRTEAKNAFLAVKNTSRGEEGGVTCWPGAVQYLLRSYTTASAIREANRSLRETKQLPEEDELSYNTRLTKAILRCGSVHSAEAKKDLFVDGLQTATKAIVTRYRETHPSKTYLELLEYSRAEGETYRARFGTAKKPSQDGTKTRPVRTSGKALHADSSVEFRDRGSRCGIICCSNYY